MGYEPSVGVGDAVSSRLQPAGSSPMKWWKGASIYQIYPRSFLDTTGSGVGDLNGCVEKLGYIADLGVDAIWLSPFFTSPMADYGYDVSDYCDVDPIFGTLADFDRLIEEAHRLDLKIIIDQVYSHTSEEHAWFKESRESRHNDKSDWYVWADAKPDGSPPNNWQSVFGGPGWTWDARRQQYYMHQFLREQPQLNVQKKVVQDALLDIAKFWLDRGVDGFRLDAINHAMHDLWLRDNPPANKPMDLITRPFDMQVREFSMSRPEVLKFLERIRELFDHYEGRFTVAEIGGENPIVEMKSFTEGETRLNTAYSFDFLYEPQISAKAIVTALTNWEGSEEEGWPSWAFSNHDAPRSVSRWAKQEDRDAAARLFMMALLALRGNVFLYQGEELGLPTGHVPFDRLLDPEAIANWPRTLGRDGARVPMPWVAQAPQAGFSSVEPWLPVDPEQAKLAVDTQLTDPGSFLNFTKRLLAIRKASDVLKLGDIRFIETEEPVLAFERRFEDGAMLCVFNLSADKVAWSGSEDDTLSVAISRTRQGEAGPCPIELGPYEGFWAL